jgi:hypothetical protein
MKTYKEFSLEMLEAATGFKKEKKSRRKRKSTYMTDREIKLQKLARDKNHWSGLE